MIVSVSGEAERDLESIAEWIARDDPERAAAFADELWKSCLELARFPKRFPLVPRYEAHGVRHRVHGKYLIFYRVADEEVVVIHILHGAMDYAAVLFAE